MRSRLGTACVVAALLGCVAALSLARADTPAIHTAQANEELAQAEAAAILTRLALPAGSVSSPEEPSGDDGRLAKAPFEIASPELVTRHAWWIVPMPWNATIPYLAARLTGAQSFVRVGPELGPHPWEAKQYSWPHLPETLQSTSLILTAAALPTGSTGLRVDSEVIWTVPRPVAEHIPEGASLMRVSLRVSGPGRTGPERVLLHRPFSVTSPRRIGAVVSALNSLPLDKRGVHGCLNGGLQIALSFYKLASRVPLATSSIEDGGCGDVTLTLDGVPQPALIGSSALDRTGFEHTLHVRLVTPPPARRRHHETGAVIRT